MRKGSRRAMMWRRGCPLQHATHVHTRTHPHTTLHLSFAPTPTRPALGRRRPTPSAAPPHPAALRLREVDAIGNNVIVGGSSARAWAACAHRLPLTCSHHPTARAAQPHRHGRAAAVDRDHGRRPTTTASPPGPPTTAKHRHHEQPRPHSPHQQRCVAARRRAPNADRRTPAPHTSPTRWPAGVGPSSATATWPHRTHPSRVFMGVFYWFCWGVWGATSVRVRGETSAGWPQCHQMGGGVAPVGRRAPACTTTIPSYETLATTATEAALLTPSR